MDNPFKKLFARKGDSVLAIDIGSSSIKIVQLKKDKGRVILETYGELSTGPYGSMAIGQAVQLDNEKVIEALSDVIKESNAGAGTAALAIPLRSSLLLNIEVPEVGKNDLHNIVPIEARKFVPVPISEVALDWWVVPEIESNRTSRTADDLKQKLKKMVEVLVVAIHNDTIKQYQAVAGKLGLELGFFEIETFSAIRAAMRNDLSASVVVDLGAGTTKVAIVDYGVVRASHTIGKGAQDLTLAISRSLSVPFEKAEEIKRKVGLVEEAGDEQKISSTISPTLEYIFEETNRVMTQYQKKANRAIDKVILIGGGALLRGLTDLAGKSFDVPVGVGTPFDKVEYPAFLGEILREAGPVFAVSLGLALRRLEDI